MTGVPDPYAQRLRALRRKMEERELDGFLVSVPENRYYLSGFEAEDVQLTESSGLLVITGSRQVLVTDFRYEEEAKAEARGYETLIHREGLDQVLPDIFRTLAVRRLGVESHHLTHQLYVEIQDMLRSAQPDAVLVAEKGFVEEGRMIKELGEIERIRASIAVTEGVLHEVWASLRPGLREKDVAWAIERGIREAGAEAVSFPPIVASGPNGALPHAVPTSRAIREDDAVVLDLGSRLRLYCSDMTRTWLGPRVPEKMKEIYRIVREAQLAAMNAVRPGVDSLEVDRIARGIIEKAGYGDAFGHGLGHGVGLAVHERPGYGRKNHVILQENMVLTVEPGIYLPGLGGVRLENMVRVSETGCESLSRNEWFVL
ncbi:M24 family metallopeptidase [Desulfoglaeba alkanexedens]|uniref:Aminopeptidase P family protein n=1 Tax=Desulfoglaeba alkanexedens ALDC TaxID=980445 RepID=A0A4P8KZX9_9BACT|nr:Xaa-Pro peptidase family protein [Desulfoglaeba alkanexedens]QCQ20990.1 aminopeptidase P family protein [Desulfoglaeba alkanexedens ALDC]